VGWGIGTSENHIVASKERGQKTNENYQWWMSIDWFMNLFEMDFSMNSSNAIDDLMLSFWMLISPPWAWGCWGEKGGKPWIPSKLATQYVVLAWGHNPQGIQ
jgi:hypothetical protein